MKKLYQLAEVNFFKTLIITAILLSIFYLPNHIFVFQYNSRSRRERFYVVNVKENDVFKKMINLKVPSDSICVYYFIFWLNY